MYDLDHRAGDLEHLERLQELARRHGVGIAEVGPLRCCGCGEIMPEYRRSHGYRNCPSCAASGDG